jgi:hypothetical protein
MSCNKGQPLILGFTAASGDPVICRIIFAAKMFKQEWRMGLKPFVPWTGEPEDITANSGDGKQYPFGPTCLFKGKEVPCYCTCNESGSKIGAILTDMLQALDELKVYDHGTGLNHFLILDGQNSWNTSIIQIISGT